jgi:putative transposase
MDVWSHRVVGWRVAEGDSAQIASELITAACHEGNVDPRGLVLHSDNGKPMRASTMIATLHWLGVIPSFSWPHVSDDNPYSEALFRTLKHTPAYPRTPFAGIMPAERWVERFVTLVQLQASPRTIHYVTPHERHDSCENGILERRHALYQRARNANPQGWSRRTRNWAPVGLVVLNPPRAPWPPRNSRCDHYLDTHRRNDLLPM